LQAHTEHRTRPQAVTIAGSATVANSKASRPLVSDGGRNLASYHLGELAVTNWEGKSPGATNEHLPWRLAKRFSAGCEGTSPTDGEK
jgi:hypothetical protein